MRELQGIVDEAIEVRPDGEHRESRPFDITGIDFERLRKEFERSDKKKTTVQNLKTVIEQRLQQLLRENPLRTDIQERYEQIVEEYNREKDRVTIERTFEHLLEFVNELDNEQGRAIREGLDEDSLAVFAHDPPVAGQGINARRGQKRDTELPLEREHRAAGPGLFGHRCRGENGGLVSAHSLRVPAIAVAGLRGTGGVGLRAERRGIDLQQPIHVMRGLRLKPPHPTLPNLTSRVRPLDR